MSVRTRLSRTASRLAIIGGLVQAIVALSLLFLPVFATCNYVDSELHCRRESYLQLGGNVLGYTFLTLIVIGSTLLVVSSRNLKPMWVFFTRWLVALISAAIVVIAGWSFGIVFLPGGLLVLISALLTRAGEKSSQPSHA